MKTCHLILVSAFLLASIALRAQIQRGAMLFGATLGANVQNGDAEHYYGGHIDPLVCYLATDRLAIGGIFSFGIAFDGENGITNFGGGPLARYYFNGSGKIRAFGQGNGVVFSQKTGAYNSRTVVGLGAGAGADIFLTGHIALEISVGYDFVYKGTFQQKGLGKFGITFGVFGVFNSGEKSR